MLSHLGSTSVTTDTSGAVTSRTRYKPFGEVLTTSGQETTGTLNTERKFTGQIYDTGTDFYYMGGRYYDRLIRRFTAAGHYASAFTLPQGLNRYSNAMNNPYSPRGGGIPSPAYSTEGRSSGNENSGSAAQSYALQAANIYNAQGPNPNVVDDGPRVGANQGSTTTSQYELISMSASKPESFLGHLTRIQAEGGGMLEASSSREIGTLAPGTFIIFSNVRTVGTIQIHEKEGPRIPLTVFFASERKVNVTVYPGWVPYDEEAWNPYLNSIYTKDPSKVGIGLLVHEIGHVFDRTTRESTFNIDYLSGGKDKAEDFADDFWDDDTRNPTHFWIVLPKKKK